MKINHALLTFTAFFFVLITVVSGQTDHIGGSVQIPAHPRILLMKGEEGTIKKTIGGDDTWNKMHQAIITECDRLIDLAPIERIQIGRRLLDKSRECIRRVFFLSYTFRMTGDKKYLQRAEKELLAVAAFSDWNPTHFLDVAEMTMGVSIGYDWLYHELPETSRAAIKQAILKKVSNHHSIQNTTAGSGPPTIGTRSAMPG